MWPAGLVHSAAVPQTTSAWAHCRQSQAATGSDCDGTNGGTRAHSYGQCTVIYKLRHSSVRLSALRLLHKPKCVWDINKADSEDVQTGSLWLISYINRRSVRRPRQRQQEFAFFCCLFHHQLKNVNLIVLIHSDLVIIGLKEITDKGKKGVHSGIICQDNESKIWFLDYKTLPWRSRYSLVKKKQKLHLRSL